MHNKQNNALPSPSKLPLWFGLIFFGIGAIMVADWSSEKVRWGAVIGVVLYSLLIIFAITRWNKRLSNSELQKTRRVAKTVTRAWIIGLMLIVATSLTWLLKSSDTREYFYGAAFVLMPFGAVLALVITYSKKGLAQESR